MASRALLLLFLLLAACGGPTRYALQVDSPAVPFKPADPDDLVVDGGDDDDDDDDAGAKPGAKKDAPHP